MDAAALALPSGVYQQLRAHLLRPGSRVEQAAFVFAKTARDADGKTSFSYIDWLPIPPEGFAIQHEYHIELADYQRGALIKRAHDLGLSLVEFHSHVGPYAAKFSPSDLAGFTEFVPHVWWRLKSRPYAAVVVTDAGFDGLAWVTSAKTPIALRTLVLDGGHEISATGLSIQHLKTWEVSDGAF